MIMAAHMWPRSVAARLYCVAALAVVAVAGLAVAAVSYTTHSAQTVTALRDEGITAAGLAADVDLLLERHRRIIESAPSYVDRPAMRTNAASAEDVARQIEGLAGNAQDPFMGSVAASLPVLVGTSRRALFLLATATPGAAAAVIDDYVKVANRMQDQLRLHRTGRVDVAKAGVDQLVQHGDRVVRWLVISAVAIVLLVGPMSVLIIRSIVRRLKAITQTMQRLANTDTAVAVPSITDADEVGDMARAVQVFKSNALALFENKKEIEKLNGWFDIALNNMARGLSMFDGSQRLVVCNRTYRELYNLPDEAVRPGTRLPDIAAYWAHRNPGAAAAALPAWCDAGSRTVTALGTTATETHALGDGRVINVSYQALADGGWVDLHEDVTEKRRAEWRISQLAHFDPLTGIANRHYFLEGLARALKTTPAGQSFAVLWLDLDRFKEVNDTLGHPAGDALLKLVSERLTSAVRSGDQVARLGGDEFAILQWGAAVGEAEAVALAGRVCRVLNAPFILAGHPVSIGVSIGIALAPVHGQTPEALIRNADIALYRAKADGRGTVVVFRSEFEQRLSARRRLEADLRDAAEQGHLELHYQPVIGLRDQGVWGCEALMRWHHPERGMVSPAEFIPLAEETGLIGLLGGFALRQACRDAATWPASMKVAVNLSAAQFMTVDLIGTVREALEAAGLPPSRLELEVTETLLLQDNAKTHEVLHELRQMGVSIALDDFGTGYASLSYLRSFPFDKIKIDQTFVRDLPDRPDCVAIVKAVCGLAATLGMRTVAEGVETAEHLARVMEAGCDDAQGYLFCRPVPAIEIVEFLAARAPSTTS